MRSFSTSVLFLLVILIPNCCCCSSGSNSSRIKVHNTKTKNNTASGIGIFAKYQIEWCLQKGLQKPQYTRCQYVENSGTTCINPQIKYGTNRWNVLPREDSGNDYKKWCEQLNGGMPSVYVNHTLGQRTGYAVRGCIGADDYGNLRNWHWCDWVDNGYWFNQHLIFIYRIVASTSPSRIEAHGGLFRSLMKGIFHPYELWQKVDFLISNAC